MGWPGVRCLAGCLVVVTACSTSRSSTAPTPPPPPVEPIPSPPTATFNGTVAAYGTASHAMDAEVGGTMTVTLTWASSVDLDLYLTDDQCASYPPDACFLLRTSTASSGNREEVSWPVKPQQHFKFWVDNFSPSDGASYTVVAVIR